MGTACIQSQPTSSQFNDIYRQAFLIDYIQSKWPFHQDLQNQLKISNIFKYNNTIVTLKHKLYDRWFWGVEHDGRPYAKGILFNKFGKNSIYYEGQFSGQPKGFGKVVYNGGEWEYNGQIEKGKANGMGNFINKKQAFKFEGEWKNSKPYIGKLTLFSNFGITSPQTLPNRQMQAPVIIQINQSQQHSTSIIRYPDGKIYRGEISKSRFTPDGNGQIIFPNQTKYIGQWSDGEMHGTGRFSWIDGSSYEGQYQFGKKHGKGKFIFTCGNYYEGFWLNGKQDGKGILYDINAKQLQNGYWKDGIFQDQQYHMMRQH